MATTTAALTITSNDLMPGSSLNITTGATELTKAGITTGLTQVESGVISMVTGTEYRLGPVATQMASDVHDIASYIYIANTSTDPTYYVDWGIHETMIGRLYAGDWMFIPWNASDDGAEIELEPQGGTNSIEYAFFNSDFILATAAS